MSTTIERIDDQESSGGEAAGRPVGHDGTRVEVSEFRAWTMNGFLAFSVALASAIGGAALIVNAAVRDVSEPSKVLATIGGALLLFLLAGLIGSSLVIVSPGDTKVVQLFGRYVGTIRKTGLLMTLPLSLIHI